ncbi:MAG: RNA polymerase sigma factor, partial [Planctomycetota bacterium]|nr:RNA polymerase sigma factor [Planctomycetota bacterium]
MPAGTLMAHETSQVAVDDAELLRRYAASGDREAMNELLARHLDVAFRTALRCSKHAADAEDAVQMACVELLRRAGAYRGEGTVRAYFMGFVVSFCRHKQREEARRSAREAAAAAPQETSAGPAAAEAREQRALVLRALTGLPEHYRLPVFLHLVEGFTHGEVAGSLSLPEKTVRTQIGRGLDALRRALTASGVTAAALPPLLASLPQEAAPAALFAAATALVAKGVAGT